MISLLKMLVIGFDSARIMSSFACHHCAKKKNILPDEKNPF